MKQSELEALVLEQGRQLQAANEAHMHLVQRADNIVEGFKQELAGRDEKLDHQQAVINEQAQIIVQAANFFESWPTVQATIEAMSERIDTLEKLVFARNSSAATKRNMTDEDALRVLTGDLKDLSHKDAAEKVGLTYAQVYSCRLEFTFKHVHKYLRDDVKDWRNVWTK